MNDGVRLDRLEERSAQWLELLPGAAKEIVDGAAGVTSDDGARATRSGTRDVSVGHGGLDQAAADAWATRVGMKLAMKRSSITATGVPPWTMSLHTLDSSSPASGSGRSMRAASGSG